jgi:hypothetical protein
VFTTSSSNNISIYLLYGLKLGANWKNRSPKYEDYKILLSMKMESLAQRLGLYWKSQLFGGPI